MDNGIGDFGLRHLVYSAVRTYYSQIMFCPSCGTEYTIELKYCNRCGANLSTSIEGQPEPVVVNLSKPTLILGTVITLVTLGGFGMVIAGAVELARNVQLGSDPVIAMVVMGMLTILTADIFLVRQLSKLINASLTSGAQAQPRRSNVLASPPVAQLPQPAAPRLQGVPSVTENTTRFLESYRAPSEGEDRTTAEKLER